MEGFTINTGVCGSIIKENKEEILETLKTMNLDNVDYIELRVDTIKNVTSDIVYDIIIEIQNYTNKPIILTNRTQKEGGYFKGSDEERIKILCDNAPLVEYTDIEYMTKPELRNQVINAANKTIISYHNFDKTPEKQYLKNIINEASDIGDIPKIAVKPHTLEDTYTILQLMMEYDNLVAISMDKLGTYTRIIGPIIGSPITYASIEETSAPGQLDVKQTTQIIKKLKP